MKEGQGAEPLAKAGASADVRYVSRACEKSGLIQPEVTRASTQTPLTLAR